MMKPKARGQMRPSKQQKLETFLWHSRQAFHNAYEADREPYILVAQYHFESLGSVPR